jgi:hypothetical protein
MIRLKKVVTLMLPFRRYPMRMSHRLLTSLGGASRFILQAVDQDLTMDLLANITGLSYSALAEQLEFLVQHDFLHADPGDPLGRPTLSERGRRMIQVEQLLQRGEQFVWLDAFTLKRYAAYLMASPDPVHLWREPARVDFSPNVVAVVPPRERDYRRFDELGRLRTLLGPRALAQLLRVFWPDAQSLIENELDHWEYALAEGAQQLDYLPVHWAQLTLRPESQGASESPGLPVVLLPVLELVTRFSAAQAFPWPVIVPEPLLQIVEMVSLGPVPVDTAGSGGMATPSAESIVLPSSLEDDPPDLTTPLPAGLSAALHVRPFHLRCAIDLATFHHGLHEQDCARIFSTSQPSTAAEAFA